ncbi:MAG: Holliday junction branch migration protein RuvA [Clostridia bacterium]|nr:Holliday junction branch migration protein RuvA [Clostridia bacterium]
MIAFVRGRVEALEEDTLTVQVGGVGLSVYVPYAMLDPYPVVGEEIMLHTHLQVRDDGWLLFGFGDREQLRLFRLLLSVTGVGAKTALAIIDKLSPLRLATAITGQQRDALTVVSGVGKKTAERILLELKDKFPATAAVAGGLPASAEAQLNAELLAALKQLGYTATEARALALKAEAVLGGQAAPELLLREALKIAMRS